MDSFFKDSSIIKVGEGLQDRLRLLDSSTEAPTLEKINDELINFGLTSREAKVYIHLARFGPQKANKIAEDIHTHRTETYHTLTSLQNKGIVTATLERPISFVALPFEKAIEKIIALEKERVSLTEKKSPHIFEIWNSIPPNIEKEIPIMQFQIFEGIDQAYGKMNEIPEKIENEISIMASQLNLARLDQEGILDKLLEKEKEIGISVKLLVDLEAEKLAKNMNAKHVRFLPPSIKPAPHFLLVDNKEVIFFTSKEDAPRKQMSAIWTNYEVFNKALSIMFNKLWNNSK